MSCHHHQEQQTFDELLATNIPAEGEFEITNIPNSVFITIFMAEKKFIQGIK